MTDFPRINDVKTFRMTGFSFDDATSTATLSYAFDDAVFFDEKITFADAPAVPDDRKEALNDCLRLLHIAAGVSYYKAYIPPQIVVETGALTQKEADFFNRFYRNGLGEFSFKNKVVPPVRFTFDGQAVLKTHQTALTRRCVVPVGGGKDSVVTLETIKASGREPVLFSVNTPRPIRDTIAVSGCPSIRVMRTISPVLPELNDYAETCGVLNGHIPVTGVFAFVLMTAAVIYDFSDVLMSNERSANVGNTDFQGQMVNHQWSKSVDFENAFADLTAAVLPAFRYFSFLRPLSELMIAKKFAAMTAYDDAFTSCNKAFRLDPLTRIDRWCGDCDKCRFVFLAFAPFMEKDRLVKIFGRNPLNEETQIKGYRELMGLEGFKPFECVGEIEESAWAFAQIANRAEYKDDVVVKALRREAAKIPYDEKKLFTPSENHRIPQDYADALALLEK